MSGISDETKFEALREKLEAFPDERIDTADYELAAKLSNECGRGGIQGSRVDFLMCAVSIARKAAIFTTGDDFMKYAEIVPIELYRSSQHD